MAVTIVDVDSEHTPTIQYGNMYVLPFSLQGCSSCVAKHSNVSSRYRIDPAKYDRDQDD